MPSILTAPAPDLSHHMTKRLVVLGLDSNDEALATFKMAGEENILDERASG